MGVEGCRLHAVQEVVDLQEACVDAVVHFDRLVEGYMHNPVVVEADHDAFLVVQEGVDCGNAHPCCVDPVSGYGAAASLDMAENRYADIEVGVIPADRLGRFCNQHRLP